MGFDLESGYREAFGSIYGKIGGVHAGPGRTSCISGSSACFHDAPADRLPNPDVLVKLYTDTLQISHKKSSGVFYTPPEVVRFMCRESLAHYLSNSTGLSFEHALGLMDRITADGQNGADIDRELLLGADRALEAIRVFDPAVGCGAFICGMLDEIVRLRSGITRYIRDISAGYSGDGSAQSGCSGRTSPYTAACCRLVPDRHPFVLKCNAVANSIHGADIDATAVEIARLRLWYGLITEYERYRSDVEKSGNIKSDAGTMSNAIRGTDATCNTAGRNDFKCNVSCADSLFEYDACGFDVIIGNPPYISAVEGSRSGRGMRRALKKKFPQLKGSFDIYAAFLLDGIRRLNGKGVFCWIVPNKLMVSQYAVPVLEYLKGNGLRYTISVSDLNVFSGVGVYPVIVAGNRYEAGGKESVGTKTRNDAESCCASEHSDSCCTDTKGSDPGKSGICTGVGSTDGSGAYGTDKCGNHGGLREYAADSLQQLETRCFFIRPKIRQYETFADHNIKIASGAAGFQAAILKQYITEAPLAADAVSMAGHPVSAGCGGFIPFAVSGSIDKYCLDRSKVRYMGTIYENPYILKGEKIADSKWKLWCSEKICIAGMTKELEAYYSREPLAIGVGTYAIYGFGGTDPFYLLALLNSRFMSWYLREKFYERHLAGGYIAVNKFMLEQLPLVRTDKKTEQELARRAEKLQQNFCGGAMAEKLLSEIDELVCMIYGLDGKETDRIRNAALE